MNVYEFSNQYGTPDLRKFSNYWLVYFLVDGQGEIVYVGKSSASGLGKRLLSHSKNKDFCSYFTQTGVKNEKEAYQLEGAFITLMRPKYNKTNIMISISEMMYLCKWMKSGKEVYPLVSNRKSSLILRISFYLIMSILAISALFMLTASGFMFYSGQYIVAAILAAKVLIPAAYGISKVNRAKARLAVAVNSH